MQNLKYSLSFLLGLLIISSCNVDDGGVNGNWIIPENEVLNGGPGKDGIPAIGNPELINASDATYLENSELIMGWVENGEARAYPHEILDWHEIINDKVGNHAFAITYCPLTGTGIGWEAAIDGVNTTFGVSGLLYNSNLIPYDRKTDSNWSQLGLDCVEGELAGRQIETFNTVETTWKTWETMYPNTKVVSRNTGYNRDYDRYPYNNYRTDEALLFPVNNSDARIHQKERVHGILINNKAKAYQFTPFQNGVTAIQDVFEGSDIVIVGSEPQNFIVSFYRQLEDGTTLDFTAIDNDSATILQDNEGNEWDIFGNAVSGTRVGQKLIPTTSFIGYWFSFPAFYGDVEVYE